MPEERDLELQYRTCTINDAHSDKITEYLEESKAKNGKVVDLPRFALLHDLLDNGRSPLRSEVCASSLMAGNQRGWRIHRVPSDACG
jgi:hypothetical protein